MTWTPPPEQLASCVDCGAVVWVRRGRNRPDVEAQICDVSEDCRASVLKFLGVATAWRQGFGLVGTIRHKCPPIHPSELRDDGATQPMETRPDAET